MKLFKQIAILSVSSFIMVWLVANTVPNYSTELARNIARFFLAFLVLIFTCMAWAEL